jgi:hypothetical protein
MTFYYDLYDGEGLRMFDGTLKDLKDLICEKLNDGYKWQYDDNKLYLASDTGKVFALVYGAKFLSHNHIYNKILETPDLIQTFLGGYFDNKNFNKIKPKGNYNE